MTGITLNNSKLQMDLYMLSWKMSKSLSLLNCLAVQYNTPLTMDCCWTSAFADLLPVTVVRNGLNGPEVGFNIRVLNIFKK